MTGKLYLVVDMCMDAHKYGVRCFVLLGASPFARTGMARHHNGCDSGAGAVDFAGRCAGFPFGEGAARVEVSTKLHNSSFLEVE